MIFLLECSAPHCAVTLENSTRWPPYQTLEDTARGLSLCVMAIGSHENMIKGENWKEKHHSLGEEMSVCTFKREIAHIVTHSTNPAVKINSSVIPQGLGLKLHRSLEVQLEGKKEGIECILWRHTVCKRLLPLLLLSHETLPPSLTYRGGCSGQPPLRTIGSLLINLLKRACRGPSNSAPRSVCKGNRWRSSVMRKGIHHACLFWITFLNI